MGWNLSSDTRGSCLPVRCRSFVRKCSNKSDGKQRQYPKWLSHYWRHQRQQLFECNGVSKNEWIICILFLFHLLDWIHLWALRQYWFPPDWGQNSENYLWRFSQFFRTFFSFNSIHTLEMKLCEETNSFCKQILIIFFKLFSLYRREWWCCWQLYYSLNKRCSR